MIRLNIIDLLLICYTAVWLTLCFASSCGVNLFELSEGGMFLLCYIVARSIPRKQWCLWGILLVGVIEAGIGLCQQLHWAESLHPAFSLTGTFGNPGPLGGCLAVAMTIAVGLYLRYRKVTRFCRLLWIVGALLGIVLLLTESRAGWLSVVVGTVCLWLSVRKEEGRRLAFPGKVVLVVLTCLFMAVLYGYKKDSADGRLLIWRVSAEMISDAPWTGHGIGTFGREYMHYQAHYFREHPHSEYTELADNIAYPYNELLRIGVEQGIVGMAFVLGIIFAVLRYVPCRGYSRVYVGAFVSLCTFALFSYPSEAGLLWLSFPLLLGGMQCRKSVSVPVGNKFLLAKWSVALACLVVTVAGGCCYHRLERNVQQLHAASHQARQEAEIYIDMHRQLIRWAPRLCDVYAQYCFRHFPPEQALPVLEQAAKAVPNSELYIDLGDTYRETGRTPEAVACYTLSAEMVPNRILPLYRLFCLYRDTGDTLRTRETAARALNMKVKVVNTKTLRMEGEMKMYLHHIHKDNNKEI